MYISGHSVFSRRFCVNFCIFFVYFMQIANAILKDRFSRKYFFAFELSVSGENLQFPLSF